MSQNESSGFPIAGIIIIMMALGTVWLQKPALKGSRPKIDTPITDEIINSKKTQARLWEDPFEAVCRDICKSNSDESSDKKITNKYIMLGVMVPGGLYFEDTETRRKMRYAVISALIASGYVPEDEEHINYKYYNRGNSAEDVKNIILPYEFFIYENSENDSQENKPPILLVWLKDTIFNPDPFISLYGIVDFLIQNKKCKVNIIGPTTSSYLKVMVDKLMKYKEMNNFCSKNYCDCLKLKKLKKLNITMLSPMATAAEKILLKNNTKPIEDLFKVVNIEFLRTILTGSDLAEVISEELDLRGRNSEDVVVLISEKDNFYGRTMPKSFKKEFKDVIEFSYLRGMDGSIVDTNSKNNLNQRATTGYRIDNNVFNNEFNEKTVRPPVGNSQYDYLRRLADEIVNLRKKKNIKAIGVLGSDVYDKLLVLQAIRKKLPDILFFTTDLDARFMQLTELKWTRNLIVASSFGLQLHKKWQSGIPPFRDNYQTSVFFSTRLLLDSGDKELSDKKEIISHMSPMLFEIGRKSAYDLKYNKENFKGNVIHPTSPNTPQIFNKKTILFFLPIILITIIFYVLRRSFERLLLLIFVCIFCLILYIIYLITSGNNSEPFLLSSGISLWPTEIIRIIAIFCTIYFGGITCKRLRKNMESLSKEFFPKMYLNKINNVNKYHNCGEMKKKRKRGVLCSSIAIGFLIGFIINGRFQLYELPKWLMFCLIPIMYFAAGGIWWYLKPLTPNKYFVNAHKEIINTHFLWLRYCCLSNFGNRFWRTIIILMIYLPFVLVIFFVFGHIEVPFRGLSTEYFDKCVILTLIFLYLFLLFFTVDATSLCIWFVKHLSERERCWLHENSNDINCPLEQWKKIKLIAERTEIVGQIIYFPLYIVIMIIVARSNYFDNWTFPTSLYIVIVLNIVISIICSYLLSKSAAKVKNEAINTLNEKLVDIRGKFYIDEILRHKQEIISKNLELIMSKINNIKSGAFCPLFQQPFVRASILFIGSCSIVITEYLRILK